ncbi:MAG: arsenate reductase ArsC, partial [Candidatus Zixiibacteriota bacterium]
MAEGFLRHFLGTKGEVLSAGLETHGVNPRAIAAMRESGIDISEHTSNNVSEYLDQQFDYAITVCDHAATHCPTFPGSTTK